MKVKAITGFYDLKEGVYRQAGDTFEVNKTRLDELVKVNFVVALEETKTTKKAD